MKLNSIITAVVAGSVLLLTSGAMASSDISKGKRIAKKCAACHTLKEGGKNKFGPNLFGIIGKPAGKTAGYRYSKAMASSGIVWNPETFLAFVAKPKKVVKGTKMSFSGIRKEDQREDLLSYFKTLK